MFTGIITDMGRVAAIEQQADKVCNLRIETKLGKDILLVGDSIACSGVCLTIAEVASDASWFRVQASEETRRCTTLADWKEGSVINLEPALRAGAPLGGHIMGGHVDGVAKLTSLQEIEGCLRIWLSCPRDLSRYIAPKCSIGLDGVSLTVNETRDEGDAFTFRVEIIPHTRSATSWGLAREGDSVNVEIDMLARYVERLLEARR